ncbi:MAG TPA: alpha/beta hydrolase [Candidatus Acidoferrum sp.]|nr:alpha/beta hydrolase [Candidatus Acidoferrum sp.]
MPTTSLSSGSIHYTDTGAGSPLVLLHANPGDLRDFDDVIPTLAQHHRVIALDWPGYGGSALSLPPEQVTLRFYYQVLREFIATLELQGAQFIGNCIGGTLAARLAVEEPHRVRSLVLVSPGGFAPHTALTKAFCWLQGSALSLSPRSFVSRNLRRRSPAALAMLQRATDEHSNRERILLNRALWRQFGVADNDLRKAAAGIKARTLLMFGKYDPVIPPDRDGKEAAASIADSQFVVMPCGRAPFAEMPSQFLAEVLPFLEECRHAHQAG